MRRPCPATTRSLTWALWVRTWSATLAGDGRKAIELGERAVEVGGEDDPISAMAGCYLAEARLETRGARRPRPAARACSAPSAAPGCR